jgi:hypothetical protein
MYGLFHKTVPFTARRALPHPLHAFISAMLAKKRSLDLTHEKIQVLLLCR